MCLSLSNGDQGMVIRIGYTPLSDPGESVEHEYGPLSFPLTAALSERTHHLELSDSDSYPGARRDVWVHLPPVASTSAPLNYCVFQDGWLYLDPVGPVRAAIVLDNLHQNGLIAPTVGIFVNPGEVAAGDVGAIKQRNVEYDPFTPTYGSFLRHEVIARVRDNIPLTRSAKGNVICGGSSGGNCALTAAWYHTELFETAICFVASFAQIPGGNPFPQVLGRENGAARRLRVFQQIALRDLNWDRSESNWVAENFRVAAALLEHGDELRCVVGDGGHNANHGGVLLPDALIWAVGNARRSE